MAVEQIARQDVQGRTARIEQGGFDGSVRENDPKRSSVGGHLAQMRRRHLARRSRDFAARLEVGDEDPIAADEQPVDGTSDNDPFPYNRRNRRLRKCFRSKQIGEFGIFDDSERVLHDCGAKLCFVAPCRPIDP